MACSDPIVIQRLLDGDLDEMQAEIVARHVESCPTCGSEAKSLSELRTFVQDQLGLEDEGEEEKSAAALAEIARRLPPLTRHRETPWWRRRMLLATAAALVVTLLAPIPFLSKAMARPEEILHQGAVRDRLWRYQPDTILHWEVDTVSRGVKNIADGRWRTVYWRKNGTTSFEETVRQLGPDGQMDFAYWRQPDGSTVNYRPARGTIEISPSTAAARNALPTLPPDLRAALETWLQHRDLNQSLEAQSRRDVDLVEGRSSWVRSGEATFSHGVFGLLGEVHHIRVVQNQTNNPRIVRAVHEYDIESESLRLLRLESTVTYVDGTVGVHDSRWVAYREGTPAEFEAQIPRDLLKSGAAVVRLSPREIATRRLKDMAAK